MEKILDCPEVYRISTEKPGNLSVNTYFVCSGVEMLVVDPPLKVKGGQERLNGVLEKLNWRNYHLKVLFTHIHDGFVGKIPDYLGKELTIYLSEQEPIIDGFIQPWSYQKRLYRREGWTEEMPKLSKKIQAEHQEQTGLEMSLLGDGNWLTVGKWLFKCIYTPGHTPGHLSLFQPETGLLFAGDCLCYEVLPSIGIWKGQGRALERQLESLEMLLHENVKIGLPAHGRVKGDFQARLKEIIGQYCVRILELYQLVGNNLGSNAYELNVGFWHDKESENRKTLERRWQEMGETLAYLGYLRSNDYVKTCRGKNGIINMLGKRRLTDD